MGGGVHGVGKLQDLANLLHVFLARLWSAQSLKVEEAT
jgi:hypothetical protein